MTVAELQKILADCNPNDLVVMSTDEEGNYFHTLYTYGEAMYLDNEVGLRELTHELVDKGYTEDDVLSDADGAVPCIVLWPT